MPANPKVRVEITAIDRATATIKGVSNQGGSSDTYYIGADPSAASRLRQALREVHRDAVETAGREIREHSWRAGE